MKLRRGLIGLLGPFIFCLIYFLFRPADLSIEGVAVLGIAVWMAIWWITEFTDIAITALLPIILFPLTDAVDINETTAAYGHRYVFLYMGGFFLAIAIEKWNLHRRIALNIIYLVGSNMQRIVLGFMLATAFMSMWISNTATSVMMLPIALAIIAQVKDHPDTPEDERDLFGKMILLSIAYSASIGGIATLFGTPPNLVFAGIVKEIYGTEITFFQWLKIGLPISLTLLAVAWLYLTRFAFKMKVSGFPGGKPEIARLKNQLGIFSFQEIIVSIVFAATAICLIARQWLQVWLPQLDDSIIAMAAGITLCLLPSGKSGGRILNWGEAVKMPWGVLILFGGGMALAKGFTTTGLAEWIGQQLISLNGLPILLILFVLIAAVNFLTEITSNLATTAMLLPILASMATSVGVHPYLLLVSATVAASCAFMLPVATPPNAVVFGAGLLKIRDMSKTGLWLNLLSICFLTFFIYFFLDSIWVLD